MDIYRVTGDKKYLAPIPKALEYYKKSLRPDGKLARFYELQTNQPLYFTKDYQLTESDKEMPTHYGFIVDSKLEEIEKKYRELEATPAENLNPPQKPRTYKMSEKLAKPAREAVAALDERGAWVKKGSMENYDGISEVIESKVFASRVRDLAKFLAATSPK
jgi:hypothetical protein